MNDVYTHWDWQSNWTYYVHFDKPQDTEVCGICLSFELLVSITSLDVRWRLRSENISTQIGLFTDHSQFTLNSVATARKNVKIETQRVMQK
jgi:hypothetical protein